MCSKEDEEVRRPEMLPSSEHIGIRDEDGRFRVWYRDRGLQRSLIDTTRFEEAAEVLTREATKLARMRRLGVREAKPGHGST